ncbi:MAG: 4a-hydroxytetrahydrobiopterin dehydratase [Acetobacteraceae bacterium]|nr:4a-hydroxytetrahydrobiopterin dehydratase [Acetobacteraceae bacterium]
MSRIMELPPGWKLVTSPLSLFRRYEFASYAETREFLDRLAVLSEETGLFPDLGFAKTYVNITIAGADGDRLAYAMRAASLAEADMP